MYRFQHHAWPMHARRNQHALGRVPHYFARRLYIVRCRDPNVPVRMTTDSSGVPVFSSPTHRKIALYVGLQVRLAVLLYCH